MDAIERIVRTLIRAHGQDPDTLGRDATALRLAARVGRARGLTDYRHGLRRGHCRKRGCRSRFAIVHVTIDTRDPERTDRSATLDCALCGHVWGSATLPDLRLREGSAPRILLTLILPPIAGQRRRVYTTRRGAIRASGSDATLVRHASYADLAAALTDWRARNGRALDRRAAVREKREAAERADVAEYRAAMADIELARAQRARLAALTATIAEAATA